MELQLKDFKQLPGGRGIWNTIVPVKDKFRLSISFNDERAPWAVGEFGSFECAIQVNSGHDQGWSLVDINGQNTFSCCDSAELDRLFAVAKKLKWACSIDVLDVRNGHKEPQWWHRFDCAKGKDMEFKIAYCQKMFGGNNYRIMTA